jgi:hypothetical protein
VPVVPKMCLAVVVLLFAIGGKVSSQIQFVKVDTTTIASVNASFPSLVGGVACFVSTRVLGTQRCDQITPLRPFITLDAPLPDDSLLVLNQSAEQVEFLFGCDFHFCNGKSLRHAFDIAISPFESTFKDRSKARVLFADVSVLGPRVDAVGVVVQANEQLSIAPFPGFWSSAKVTVKSKGQLMFAASLADDGSETLNIAFVRAWAVIFEQGAMLAVHFPDDFMPMHESGFAAVLVRSKDITVAVDSVTIEAMWPDGAERAIDVVTTLILDTDEASGLRFMQATFSFSAKISVEADDTTVPTIVAVVVTIAAVVCISVIVFLWARKLKRHVGTVSPPHYLEHAAQFKVGEGSPYGASSLPSNKGEPNDGEDLGTAAKATQVVSSAPRVDSEFTSARAETWAIEIGDLELGSVLGQGAFGVVRRAEWRGRTVAVKQIKKSTIGDDKAVADFEEEIGRMAALPMHENVVRLFGVVELANGDVGAVVEFCAQGALVDALYGEKARDLSPDELLQIAYDAACGVMHLHANKIVHRDIAARNVLLAGKKDLVAKVSDFGMARDIESVYSGVASEQHTAASIGPVKWMAPEQLERMAYSRASDVFAFGVLLYEIFARAAPWTGVANVNVITQVLRGNRMELSRVPTELRDTVQRCWAQEPRDRPTMQQVVLALKM